MASASELTPLAKALGKIPSGLFILTTRFKDAGETAMLASWVVQAGFEPPSVSVAVKKDRPSDDAVQQSGVFCLNLLAKPHGSLIGHFAKGFEPGVYPFEGINIDTTPSGCSLLKDSMGYLDCKVMSAAESGDHRIYVAEVMEAKLFDDLDPSVHIRKNGLSY